MNDRYIKLKIEAVINKSLYEKNVIDKYIYEETTKKIDKLIFEVIKNKKEV